jgi:hypothetical protein
MSSKGTAAIGLASLGVFVVSTLLFVELVSFARAYKNVNRFFFTRITYTAGSSTVAVADTQDPYQIFGLPFSASLVTVASIKPYTVVLTLDQASKYSFIGATIDAQTEDGGFVTVDKSLANNLIMTAYTLTPGSSPTLNTGANTIDLRITWNMAASR